MKNNKRFYCIYFLVSILLITNCSGTLGTIQKYKFNISHDILEKKLIEVISSDTNMNPKGKWITSAERLQNDMKFLKFYFAYYNSNPEEMIVIKFSGDSLDFKNNTQSQISISATIKYNSECNCLYFNNADKLSDEEQEDLRKRVEITILNKLGYEYKRVDVY